tara:strand:+ start:279 stop:1472 length:1194 start_codon:yes stop_codon:yes gene_type:complete
MSSILKVNTIRPESGTSITIGADGEAVVNNSPSLTRQATSANPITFTVTVAAKTSANVYNGAGSSNAYYIDGQEAPSILVEGNESSSYEYYYRFDQSDNSNTGHPLVFYLDASKSQSFTTNITTNGTPGSSGAYTQIKVGGYTPHVLYYQCSSHSFMGNKLINPATKTFNLSGAAITLPTGTGNADQVIKVASTSNGISTLTFGSSVTFPTISSINPSVIENSQTAVTITGTNFQSIPFVDAINSSTGAIVTADSVAFTSATTIVATFTISVDGTYFLRVENNDGLSVRSGSALLTVSDAPTWTTAAGSLGTVANGGTINFTVAATNATTFGVQSGSLPGGASLNTSTGAITGTETGSTATTTYTFTIRATDAEGQTADRQFTITISHGASGGGQFN